MNRELRNWSSYPDRGLVDFMYRLPDSSQLNIAALSGLFNSTTNSYKYLWFLSILDILKRRDFDPTESVRFRELVIEMLANAWYSHQYFKLSFGTQDRIANKLDTLQLDITNPILRFTDTDKQLLRQTISAQNIDDIVAFISRYVPYRLIRPFFEQETRAIKDAQVNATIIQLAKAEFNLKNPLYCFDAEELKDCNAIILYPNWVKYFQDNYAIVWGWVSWEWLKYMQARNPNIPNVVNKLFMPQQRDSLTQQKNYWKTVLTNQEVNCIYSQTRLDPNQISLDHYLPWSFVAHDRLWNLIPTLPSVNSAKSNHLPAPEYFDKFVALQHLGLTVSHQNYPRDKWLKYTESFIAELKVSQGEDLLNLEILSHAYERTINPLIGLASLQGFSQGWVYDNEAK
ncbi:HNH endonuclease domain-containing protein [Roseofilum sp. SBFL]|uniref:HNH endonuclease domain-containing protein n=1 Tax=Roseofilum sp. SBFL TaxID=2821496 RepID=UPI00298E4723|nr:HNH endonuclease domain-containing protein [Roseofilum sp. SBFL]